MDYKISSKLLANRLKKVLPKLISINQSSYVQDRYIGDALRTIGDLLDYTELQNIPGIMMCIDFEKAFDSLSWNFLLKTLKAFNFGESFQRWIKIFYNDITSCIMSNGKSTGYFEIKRGVRQGDPLSAYLFILVTELLTRAIYKEESIQGIKINEEEIKLVQYADDTTLFLQNIKSAENLFKLLTKFEKSSGLKINIDKTEAMWIGSDKYRKETPLNVKWKTSLKILGIYFSYDNTEALNLNYNSKIADLEKTLNLWKMRDLTLLGKILITKSLGISKFIYTASVMELTEEKCTKIDKLIYDFIWNSKKAKIKKLTLIGKYADGGLKAPHLKTMIQAQRAMWIKRYISNKDALWKSILNFYLKDQGGELFCHCNYDESCFPKNISKFYKECLKQWQIILKSTDYRQEPINQF